jgi:hypothetical protein
MIRKIGSTLLHFFHVTFTPLCLPKIWARLHIYWDNFFFSWYIKQFIFHQTCIAHTQQLEEKMRQTNTNIKPQIVLE